MTFGLSSSGDDYGLFRLDNSLPGPKSSTKALHTAVFSVGRWITESAISVLFSLPQRAPIRISSPKPSM